MRLAPRVALAAVPRVAGLAGCRTRPPPAPVIGPGADAPWPEQYAGLAKLDRYSLTGRVAVAANGQGFSASLRYAQQPQRADLALDGPLGIGGLRVQLDDRDLSVTNSRGETLDGAAARAELERRLGFALPLAELRWWLLGLPAPGDARGRSRKRRAARSADFVQNGWHVSINSRAPGLGFALPQRLTAERDGARMKLLVRDTGSRERSMRSWSGAGQAQPDAAHRRSSRRRVSRAADRVSAHRPVRSHRNPRAGRRRDRPAERAGRASRKPTIWWSGRPRALQQASGTRLGGGNRASGRRFRWAEGWAEAARMPPRPCWR